MNNEILRAYFVSIVVCNVIVHRRRGHGCDLRWRFNFVALTTARAHTVTLEFRLIIIVTVAIVGSGPITDTAAAAI